MNQHLILALIFSNKGKAGEHKILKLGAQISTNYLPTQFYSKIPNGELEDTNIYFVTRGSLNIWIDSEGYRKPVLKIN